MQVNENQPEQFQGEQYLPLSDKEQFKPLLLITQIK